MPLDFFEQVEPPPEAPPDTTGLLFPRDPGSRRRTDKGSATYAEPRHVLIVEDSRPLRELYRVILEASGYVITLAEDGVTGLAAALRERPDVIMVDIGMPVKDGVTMLEELRKVERRRKLPSAPAVLLSASPIFPEIDAESLGVAAMLDKAHLPPRKIVSVVTAHLPRN